MVFTNKQHHKRKKNEDIFSSLYDSLSQSSLLPLPQPYKLRLFNRECSRQILCIRLSFFYSFSFIRVLFNSQRFSPTEYICSLYIIQTHFSDRTSGNCFFSTKILFFLRKAVVVKSYFYRRKSCTKIVRKLPVYPGLSNREGTFSTL